MAEENKQAEIAENVKKWSRFGFHIVKGVMNALMELPKVAANKFFLMAKEVVEAVGKIVLGE